ncbi:MAG: putative DNA modification/repair radical SAM protein, partial [Sphingobacterium sp.]
VYYSGYIPISNDHQSLPQIGSAPPLIRENRLYQTDWLMRFYGFQIHEILNTNSPHLDLQIDPKLSWALNNPQYFPININLADYWMIIRIPGIGRQSAMKIIQARKFGQLREYQVKRMGIAFNRAKYFMICADTIAPLGYIDMDKVRHQIIGATKTPLISTPQLSLF